MYTVKLKDGTELKNLTLNGNNFIAESIIEDTVFKDNLETVTITDEETGTSETHKNMVLVQNVSYDEERSWFILGEESKDDKAITDLQVALAEVYEMMLGGV